MIYTNTILTIINCALAFMIGILLAWIEDEVNR